MINDKKDFFAIVRKFGMLDRFALQQLNKSSRLKSNTNKYQTRKFYFDNNKLSNQKVNEFSV